MRVAHPSYQNQDAHLTYARALEAQGKLDEADYEYRELVAYFIGAEARTRYGLLLTRLGEPARARRLFEEVAQSAKARGVVLTPEDRDWVKVAQRNL